MLEAWIWINSELIHGSYNIKKRNSAIRLGCTFALQLECAFINEFEMFTVPNRTIVESNNTIDYHRYTLFFS